MLSRPTPRCLFVFWNRNRVAAFSITSEQNIQLCRGEDMNANALLLSRDKQVQIILPVLLSGMRIETEIVTDVLRALGLLGERKFEAIIVDCELNGADIVLKDIDSYPSNRTAVPFAIVTEADVHNGLPPGAKFMMAKPIS